MGVSGLAVPLNPSLHLYATPAPRVVPCLQKAVEAQ
jgi:hypothetical protein